MPFVFHIYTPGVIWGPTEAISLAINSQAGVAAQIEMRGNLLHVSSRRGRYTTTASLQPFEPAAYESVATQYLHRMTDRDRDTALPFQRTLVLATEGSEVHSALLHVTVADGLWWLLGGFLADPVERVLWGWRSWRTERTLAQHAAPLVAMSQTAAPIAPPVTLRVPARAHATHAPGTQKVTVYTLPYCPDCRAVKELLDSRSISYQEINVSQMPGAVGQMLALNEGKRSAPTVRVGEQVLVDPDAMTLVNALRAAGLM
jgi:glutaredoxin